ncbi:MAG: DUF5606 domain-containing protein [Bacteroidales bacterium]|nr:DUF5606 domain-containing protein [Bacteroidales bacterium]MDD3906616.1 DUF5606 domain-containing protein [Bacteroidales bacterium]MDD4712396.1 DUF5606 domain-containing protein [Bacteroidales bacterium]
MLKKIVAISGKPGLYKVLSQGKNILIVENLSDGKRMPAHSTDKVVALNDVSMFTKGEDKPLREILEALKAKENGAKASIDPKSDAESLRKFFEEIVPDFDRERVYPTDIKKLIQWYNILVETGHIDFSVKEEAEEVKEP